MASFFPAPERAGATVLAAREQIEAAAAALDERGWSWRRRGRLATWLLRLAGWLGVGTYPILRYRTKSWDVWRTVNHLLETSEAEVPVLDVGAWQSEVLWVLRRAGFRNLTGCDTDPRIIRMPGAGEIRYVAADFFDLELAPSSLGAVSCLSVIEHGMDAGAFFTRVARILAPGGRLFLTTDYWPVPVDTDGLSAFGRPWTIASRQTVEDWLGTAHELGLEPDGPVSLDAAGAPITWNNRSYTFLWLALRKQS